jgi:membrane-bound serine protease (ClpP class)
LALWTVALVASIDARAEEVTTPRVVPVAEMRGIITPTMAAYVDHAIADAEAANAPLLILTMDTPGGLDSAMRDITQRMLASRVPVAVFVYPGGARAASAGMYIAYGAHIAAMAPSTNIGSAHPVLVGSDGNTSSDSNSPMLDKVTNDAVAWVRSLAELRGRNADWAEQAVRESANLQASEALRLNVIDVVADDLPDLLRQLDGRTVKLASGETRLNTAGLSTESRSMSLIERALQVISDPSVAYLLLSLGGLALVYELSNPGAILPGVVGGIAVLLALYALGTLPVNLAGVGLILFALLLVLADLWLAGSGVLTVGAIISFVLGTIFLATAPGSDAYLRVSTPIALGTSIGFAAGLGFIAALVLRTHFRKAYTGREAMIGESGVAKTDVGEDGTVLVEGELWQASAASPETPITAGQRVRVVSIQGLHVTVRPE